MYSSYPSIFKYSDWRRASLLGLLLALCLPIMAAAPSNDDCVDESTYASVPLGPYLIMACPDDFDCDLVLDVNDLDDDNDGILDTDECAGIPEITFEFRGTFGEMAEATTGNLDDNHRNYLPGGITVAGYSYGPTFLNEGNYAITNFYGAAALHSGFLWSTLKGHTTGTDEDAYLAVNGATSIGIFFQETVTLAENADYEFGVWVANANSAQLTAPELKVELKNTGGTVVASATSGGATAGGSPWIELKTTFNTGAETDFTLEVSNLNTSGGGNDFALDDVFFRTDAVGSICNEDGDSNENRVDYDSDGDGCNDVLEAGYADGDNDGELGTGTPVVDPNNGLVVGHPYFNGSTTAVIDNTVASCCTISITSATPTAEGCPGADDGMITVVATGAATIDYTLSGNGITPVTNQTGTFTGLADGSYDIAVADATDGSCSATQTGVVIAAGTDTEAPTFTCPASFAAELDLCGDYTLTAEALNLNASDACGGTVTVTLSQTAFSGAGTTDVTVTVSDGTNSDNSCVVSVTLSENPNTFSITTGDDDLGDQCPSNDVVISAATLLGNDNASDGRNIEVQDVTLVNSAQGTVVNNNDGTFTFSPANGVSGAVAFEYLVTAEGDNLFFSGNGHYYDFVEAPGITWDDAKIDAEGRSLFGEPGYLVTITSQAEQGFVTTKLQGQGWMGATDLEVEGTWKWVVGPEAGTAFWQGQANGSSIGGAYTNWQGNEPNNLTSASGIHVNGEDYAHFRTNGQWNDFPLDLSGTNEIQGYVVEYGSNDCIPDFTATGNISLNLVDDEAPVLNCKTSFDANLGINDMVTVSASDLLNGVTTDNCATTFTEAITGGDQTYGCGDVGAAAATLTVTVDDGNGNAAVSCDVTINVTDTNSECNSAPTMTCAPVTVDADGNCMGAAAGADFVATSNDPDGDALTFTAVPGGPYALGTTNVTVTADDGNGGTATCTTTITVEDNTAPIIDCPAPVTILTSELGGGGGSLIGGDVFYPFITDLADENGVGADATPTGSNSISAEGFCVPTAPLGSGVPGYVNIQAGPNFDHTDFRFSFDAKLATFQTRVNIGPGFDLSSFLTGGTSGRWLSFGVTPDGTVGIGYNNHLQAITTTTVGLDEWHSYEAIYSNGTVNAYLDGNLIFTQAITFDPTFGPVNDRTFSTRNFSNGGHLQGCIRNFSIDGDPTLSGGGDACEAEVDLMATATDNCGTVNITDDAPAMYGLGTTTVTFTATDGVNLTSSCTSTVTLVDDVDPDMPTLDALTGECSVTAVAPTTTDACGGTITGTTSDPLTYSDQGSSTITWTFTDASNNSVTAEQTVTVQDNTAPIIDCPAPVTILTSELGGGGGSLIGGDVFYPFTTDLADENGVGADATPTGSNSISAEGFCVPTAPLGSGVPGYVNIQAGPNFDHTDFRFSFDAKLATFQTRVNIGPGFDLSSFLTGGTSGRWLSFGVTPDGTVGIGYNNHLQAITTTTVGLDEWHSYEAIYSNGTVNAYLDGNLIFTQAITFDPTFGPVNDRTFSTRNFSNGGHLQGCIRNFSIDGDPTLSGGGDACEAEVDLMATATDNCGTVNITDDAPAMYGLGTTTVTFTATDGVNLTSSCTSTVTLVDDVDPDMPTLDALTGECSVTAVAPTTTDACGGTITGTTSDPLTYSDQGSSTITWTFTDASNNSVTAEQTVTVQDNTAPIIDCPAPVTILTSELGGGGGSLIGGDVFYPFTTDLADENGVGADATPTGSNSISAEGFCVPTAPLGSGVPGYVNIQAGPNFDHTDFRFSFDAKLATFQTRVNIGPGFDLSSFLTGGTSGRWLSFGVTPDGTVGIGYNNHLQAITTTTVGLDEWHSYEAIYSNGTVNAYLDGNLIFTQAITFDPTFGPVNDRTFSTRNFSNGGHLQGCIRNFSIDGDPTLSGGGDACEAEVDLMANATDNCGTVNITDDAPAMYGLGTTTVTFTATDGVNLTSSCTSTVTLVDDVDPDAVCASAFSIDLEATQSVTITPDMLDDGTSDNCSTVNLAIDGGNPTYTCDDLGQTFTLQLNVADGSNNSSNCTVDVTITDTDNVCYTCDLGFSDGVGGNPPGIITSRIVCGNDGTITVNAFCNGCDDGNADLRYSISPDPNAVGQQTSNVFAGLTDGDYTVTILDVDHPDCNASTSATIGECVGEIPGNNIDDDCDTDTDEPSSIAWVLLDSGEGCTSNTDDCAGVFCYGLEYTPTVSGTLTSYTTGFLSSCIAGSTPLISNLSCVMDDNSFDADDCGDTGAIFFNSSGNNGTLELTKDMPVILHQICLSIPAETTLMLTKDEITDITLSIDVTPILSTDDIIVATDRPDYTEATAAGNMPPAVTANAGAVDACYATVADAEAAALLATTATDDFTPVGSLVTTVATVGTCSATVTVTVEDACGLTTDVTYATRIDSDDPVITGTLETLTDEGCVAGDARAAADNVADLEAMGVAGFDIMDNCTDDATLAVTYADASTGTCPVVVTRTYTITDECGNSSTVEQTINVEDTTSPAVTGAITPTVLEGCDISVAPAAVSTVADLEGLLGDLLIEDACTDDATLAVTHEDVVGTACPIIITRTYTITDACTNFSEVVHTITVEDTVLPEITATGTINACYTTVALAEAAALAAVSVTDNCDATITGIASTVGDCTATITINAQDACGNDAVPVTFNTQITGGAVPTEVGGPVAISADIQNTLDNVVPDAPVFEDVCGNTLTPSGPAIGGTYVEGTCEGTITYTYTYTDCAGTSVDWTFTYNVNCEGLRIKVYIEGGLNAGFNMLNTDYNENHLLPGQNNGLSPLFAVQIATPTPAGHPYGDTPWSFTDTDGTVYGDFAGQTAYPDHVADWVLVTVRMGSRAPAANVWQGAGWLHENGEVTFPEGSLANDVTLDAAETYYIVVEHRNHLPVLATATVQGSGANLYLEHDFTVADSYAPIFRFGQKEVAAGVFAMYAGNADQMSSRASINSSDRTGWRIDQTKVGYYLGDFNQNMTTNSEDETIWKINQNKTTGIIFD